MTVRKVLIPVDFSLCSHIAALAGTRLAKRLDIEAKLVHVIEPVPALGLDAEKREAFEREILRRANDAMARTLADLSAESGDISSSILQGEVGWELLRAASHPPASLIVIGSSGRADDEPFLLGSVAARLIRDAKCPVLVMRNQHATRLPKDGLFKQPLAAIDYSRFSELAVQYAAALSEPDATVELYHALFVPRFELYPRDEVDKVFAATFEYNRKKQATRLHAVAEAAAIDRKVKPLIEMGRAGELISEHIEKNDIDLVVTGAHGSRSSEDLLIGSVADRLLRGSAAPVLCIPDGAVREGM